MAECDDPIVIIVVADWLGAGRKRDCIDIEAGKRERAEAKQRQAGRVHHACRNYPPWGMGGQRDGGSDAESDAEGNTSLAHAHPSPHAGADETAGWHKTYG